APGHGEHPMRGPGGKEALATIEGLDPSVVFGNLAEVERPHLAEEEEAVRGARGEPAEDPSRGQAAVALDRDLGDARRLRRLGAGRGGQKDQEYEGGRLCHDPERCARRWSPPRRPPAPRSPSGWAPAPRAHRQNRRHRRLPAPGYAHARAPPRPGEIVPGGTPLDGPPSKRLLRGAVLGVDHVFRVPLVALAAPAAAGARGRRWPGGAIELLRRPMGGRFQV